MASPFEESFDKLFNNQQLVNIEYQVKRKDGQWIWLQNIANTIREINGKKYAYGVFSDITARKKAEFELEKHQNQLDW